MPGRGEPFHRQLASPVSRCEFSARLFRYFDSRCSTEGLPRGGPAVAGELVGDEHPRHVPQSLEQSAENFMAANAFPGDCTRRRAHSVLVDRAPQVGWCR